MDRRRPLLFTLVFLLLCFISPSATLSDLLQRLTPAWQSTCDVKYDVDSDVNATINCHLTREDRGLLRLVDLRTGLGSLVNSTGLTIALNLTCEDGGLVSLPWPTRAPGLVKLTVVNCRLLDKYADFNTSAERIADSLRVLDMRDCTWLNRPETVDMIIQNAEALTSEYECGQDSTLQFQLYRNISDMDLDFTCITLFVEALKSGSLQGAAPGGFGNVLSLDEDTFQEFVKAAQNVSVEFAVCAGRLVEIRNRTKEASSPSKMEIDPLEDARFSRIQLNKIQVNCRFERLEVMDESFTSPMDRKHFEYMVKDSEFPQLRILNYSHTGLDEVPQQIREWRIYFHESNLSLVDLSHNRISQVGLIPPYANPLGNTTTTTIDVSHNAIKCISKRMLHEWAWVPGLFVDISDNPIDCCCDPTAFAELLTDMRNRSLWTGKALSAYWNTLSTLRCASPPRLSGRLLSSLNVDEDLQCSASSRMTSDGGGGEAHSDTHTSLVTAVGVLSVLLLICVLILVVLAVRFRHEVFRVPWKSDFRKGSITSVGKMESKENA